VLFLGVVVLPSALPLSVIGLLSAPPPGVVAFALAPLAGDVPFLLAPFLCLVIRSAALRLSVLLLVSPASGVAR
jgi:hypothetical protein